MSRRIKNKQMIDDDDSKFPTCDWHVGIRVKI